MTQLSHEGASEAQAGAGRGPEGRTQDALRLVRPQVDGARDAAAFHELPEAAQGERKKAMTIDERLEFLVESTESLHVACQELHATVAEHARQIEALTQKEANLTRAMLRGIRAYLEAMNGEENEGEEGV